jgi:serine/threonine protein kinase
VRKTLREDAVSSETRRKALFKDEKRCLKLLGFPDHPNIVPLLSSYIHGKDHCLLFPVLNMDLAVFFKRACRYGNFQWNFTFFSALHGLSSALSRTHDVHVQAEADGLNFAGIGYHHDLRPAYILVNKETFILADFGMSQLKTEGEDSQTNWKLGFGDYLAPDCMDENFVHQNMGRAINVWAFGCLMAEVATFMYRGPKGLSEFRASSKSATLFSNIVTTCFHDSDGKLKESVREWLGFLISDDRPASLDKPFYELILSLLTPAKERPKIAQVCKYLAHLSLKAHFFAVLELLT